MFFKLAFTLVAGVKIVIVPPLLIEIFSKRLIRVRFHVLKALSVKTAAFWDIALCTLLEVERLFRGAYFLHHCTDDGGNTYF
jgi:hypothetical protein